MNFNVVSAFITMICIWWYELPQNISVSDENWPNVTRTERSDAHEYKWNNHDDMRWQTSNVVACLNITSFEFYLKKCLHVTRNIKPYEVWPNETITIYVNDTD